MPVYQVELTDAAGRKAKRQIRAGSKEKAIVAASDTERVVVAAELDWSAIFRGTLKKSEVVDFLEYMARLQELGDLPQALDLCFDSAMSNRMRWVIKKISEKVGTGRSLSASMSETASFTDEVIAVVEAGEESGDMNKALSLLAKNLDARGEGLKNIKNKLIYPAFSLVSAIGLGIFMLTYILPGMASGFQKANLPTITKFALGIGLFIKTWWLLLVFLIIGCVLVSIALYFRYEEILMAQLIKVPIFKKLIRGSVYSSFFINLGLLLENGVDILKAVRVLGRSTEGKLYQRSARDYQDALLLGMDLVTAVDRDPFLGKEAAAYMRQGMATSQLGWASSRLGQHYQKEMENILTKMTAFAEPIVLLLAGSIIGVLIIAVLRPMMNLSTGIRF